MLLDGDYDSWIKFANSLRMRLAMRIAVASPEKAKTEFRKAMDNEYGVIREADESVAVSTASGYTNPLGEINLVWNEAYMGAPMESILNGYEDPRREIYLPLARMNSLQASIAAFVRVHALHITIIIHSQN